MTCPHDGPCVLDVLQEVFSADDAASLAVNHTCFPMDCNTASAQAREIVDAAKRLGPSSEEFGAWLFEREGSMDSGPACDEEAP